MGGKGGKAGKAGKGGEGGKGGKGGRGRAKCAACPGCPWTISSISSSVSASSSSSERKRPLPPLPPLPPLLSAGLSLSTHGPATAQATWTWCMVHGTWCMAHGQVNRAWPRVSCERSAHGVRAKRARGAGGMHAYMPIYTHSAGGGRGTGGGRTAAAALGHDEALSWRDEVAQDLAALGAHEGARRHRDDELARVVDVRRYRRARADLAVLVSSSTLVWHLLASDPVESVLQYGLSSV